MKRKFLLLAILLANIIVNAQAPNIDWQKTYGGSDFDGAHSIQLTTDGGYIVLGYTKSNDGDITENKGSYDVWIIKLNLTGDTLWQKTYGGSDYEDIKSIQETIDGGYILAGYTKSNDGDILENKGNFDIWIVKLNSIGDIIWQKTYGGSGDDVAYSIQETIDGGYIVLGYTDSNDGDITENKGSHDVWIIKLNLTGDTLWQKTYGGSMDDYAFSIQKTTNGEYIVIGSTGSNDGDITENKGNFDIWIVKLNSIGDIIWQKTYGGLFYERANSIQESTDGGYIFAGSTESNDGDITENKGFSDAWVVKINNVGDILWQKTYGGSMEDYASSIRETTNVGYLIAGSTRSNDSDITENKGSSDAWVVKINNVGDTLWQKTYGGSDSDRVNSIQETTYGGYIIAGYTKSNDGDITENRGSSDIWIVKLFADTSSYVKQLTDNNFLVYPNPTNDNIQITISNEQIGNTIQITDINGRVVKQLTIEQLETLTIGLSNQAKGVYIVKLIGESGVSTQKLILE